MSDSLNTLTELFRRFPGIGPRQAKRFAYFLLTQDGAFLSELTRRIAELKKNMSECSLCHRFFEMRKAEDTCVVCRDQNRSDAELVIVTTDTDLDSLEKSGCVSGRYFVLGGTLALLEAKQPAILRFKELQARIKSEVKKGALQEIIVALSANPDGEHTGDELRKILTPLIASTQIKISTLGRGLSTGSELEYADSVTLKSALKNRI